MNLKEIKKWDIKFQKHAKDGNENIHGEGTYKEIDILKGNVLDLGCGDMEYLSYIKQSDDNYLIGLDFCKKALKLAKKKVKNKNIALVRAESEYLPFVQDAFDKVLCIEVMHHLENLAECKRTIKEIGRVSRSGALITFHHKDYSTIFEKINGKPVENEVMIFDETEVNEMLKEAGFSPTKMKIHRSGDMWQIPIYEPWPYDIPPYETKAVMQVECNKS